MKKLLAVWILIASVAPGVAYAKTLYVDASTGNDATSYANNGPSNPWRTIGRAAWGSGSRTSPNAGEAARAGDRVVVRAGTYTTVGSGARFTPAYTPVNEGTAAAPLVFEAEGTAVLNYSSGEGPVIGSASRNYVTWKGPFYINEANAHAAQDTGPVTISGAHHVIIDGVVLVGRTPSPWNDNYNGIRVEGSSDITLRNNRISNFASTQGINSDSIQFYTTGGHNFVEHNHISNGGSGIFLKQVATAPGPGRYTIRFNLLENMNTAGISVHRSGNPPSLPIEIYQNVFVGRGSVPYLRGFGDATDPRNVWIVNNTVRANSPAAMYVSVAPVVGAGHRVANNIFTALGGQAIYYSGSPNNRLYDRSTIAFDRNLYFETGGTFASLGADNPGELHPNFAQWQAAGQDTTGVFTNPQFVNADGGDFHLQAGSPARNRGIDVLDLNHNGSTSDTINLGAYVTGSEVIGPTTQVSGLPPAPTGLRLIPGPQN